ncbi:MAG: acyl-CoA thioesterase [Luteolibacter sp.]
MENPVYRQAGEIAFGDTDASGWMHFPNVFKYVEVAEHAFLRGREVLVFDRAQGGWPRVKVSCDYQRPFTCGDRFEVLLDISRIGASSVAWNFEVLNAAGEIAAFGSMTTVRVDHEGRPKLISDEERTRLEHGIHLA